MVILGDFVTLELAARSLVGQCFRHLGRMWPAAAVLVVLGHIVTNLIDADESRNLEVLDNDKAFDKVHFIQETIKWTGMSL